MRNSRKRAAKETPPPPEAGEATTENNDDEQPLFELKWVVEWSGTFPIGKVTAENVAKRLDALLGVTTIGGCSSSAAQRRLAGTRALLSISPRNGGVQASAVENPKLLFLAHPLRKVCCVVGRAQTCQMAYITREQSAHHGQHIPYRKQCHVFRTATPLQVEHIEAALTDAFQREIASSRGNTTTSYSSASTAPPVSPSAMQPQHLTSANIAFASSMSALPTAKFPTLSDCPTTTGGGSPMKTPNKDKYKGSVLLDQRNRAAASQMRLSSTSLIQRIFGTGGGGGATPKGKSTNMACASPKKLTPSSSGFRFRKPRWPLTPFRSSAVSAASPSAITPKCARRMRQQQLPCVQFSVGKIDDNGFVGTEPTTAWTNGTTPRHATHHCCVAESALNAEGKKPVPSRHELVYDKKLKEWIYPMDDGMMEELERLAYFCRPTEKDLVMCQLRRMPIGHFVLRLSGSRRRCLALSVRVEEDERNPKGIAHYLLLCNEHGFRINGSKRYFPSLPMLVTHHSVLADELLPCRLLLSDWRWTRSGETAQRRRQSSGGSTLAVLMRANGQSEGEDGHTGDTMIRWRRKTPLPLDNRRRLMSAKTSSTLFSSQSSTVLSA